MINGRLHLNITSGVKSSVNHNDKHYFSSWFHYQLHLKIDGVTAFSIVVINLYINNNL